MTWLAIHAKLLLLICPKSHPTKNYRRDVHGLFHTDQLGWKSSIAKIIGITYRGGNVTNLIKNYGQLTMEEISYQSGKSVETES